MDAGLHHSVHGGGPRAKICKNVRDNSEMDSLDQPPLPVHLLHLLCAIGTHSWSQPTHSYVTTSPRPLGWWNRAAQGRKRWWME